MFCMSSVDSVGEDNLILQAGIKLEILPHGSDFATVIATPLLRILSPN